MTDQPLRDREDAEHDPADGLREQQDGNGSGDDEGEQVGDETDE